MSENPRKKEPAEPPEAEAAPSEPAPAEPVEASIEEQLAAAKEEARKYLGNWQRAEADFQNYKRRVEQERDENRRFASAALVINILPILDDLERALGSLDARLAGLTWFEGVALIHRKLMLLLENAGVTIIEAEGQQFDPGVHESVMQAEGEEGKVLAEVQRGYKLYDRVLRPAMVVVGKGKGKEEEKKEEEGSGKKEEEGKNKEDQQS
ncbi:MAG: nucleotide exchange factor GrpE [Chloroflexi bacterium]|nr:nucleotide exchange factor GrpE [Chloroflexota bacterium]